MAADWPPFFTKHHKYDLDLLLHFHTERLLLYLREQTRRELPALLRRAEAAAAAAMKNKEEEIAAAAVRTAELQNLLKRMEVERCTWERLAKEKESAAMDLNRTLANLSAVGDAESWCDFGKGDEENGNLCRRCGENGSCMVIIPCRHLCCCKDCESSMGLCPVCESSKTASMEVFFV